MFLGFMSIEVFLLIFLSIGVFLVGKIDFGLMAKITLNKDITNGVFEHMSEFDVKECIKLHPCNQGLTKGLIIMGKNFNSKILNESVVKSMI